MHKSLAIVAIAFCGAFVSCRPKPVSTASAQPTQEKIPPAGPVVSYANTVDHVAPAVVTVRASKRTKVPQQFPFSDDPLFQWLFGSRNRQSPGSEQQQQLQEVERALGSGVIVRSDGHILTNDHVVDGAQEIQVDLADRRSFKAKLVGLDKPSDLAVLKIDSSNLPVLSLGNSDKVRVGDICLAVGNPLGIGETVTAGIISAKSRNTGVSNGSFEDFLQTDAPINQGNSGGALVDTSGALIGINSQIVSTSGGNIGIGFAIPSNMAKTVLAQLIKNGKVTRGQLGVQVQYINSHLANSLGMKEVKGVLVNHVDPGGPADHAGLKEGDVILGFNGSDVNDVNALRNKVAETAPGTDVALTILRNGNQQQLHMKVGEFQPEKVMAGNGNGEKAKPSERLGMTVTPLTPDLASQIGVSGNTHGLVVEKVDPAGPAADAGVDPGDVIEQINRQPVNSTSDVGPALKKSGDRPALLLVNRRGQTLFMAVQAG